MYAYPKGTSLITIEIFDRFVPLCEQPALAFEESELSFASRRAEWDDHGDGFATIHQDHLFAPARLFDKLRQSRICNFFAGTRLFTKYLRALAVQMNGFGFSTGVVEEVRSTWRGSSGGSRIIEFPSFPGDN